MHTSPMCRVLSSPSFYHIVLGLHIKYKFQMYSLKLVYCGVVVMVRALHTQGIGFYSGPRSTQFSPLIVFHCGTVHGWHSFGSCIDYRKVKELLIPHQRAHYLFDLVPIDLVVSLNSQWRSKKNRESLSSLHLCQTCLGCHISFPFKCSFLFFFPSFFIIFT